jgi:hypothetical protein
MRATLEATLGIALKPVMRLGLGKGTCHWPITAMGAFRGCRGALATTGSATMKGIEVCHASIVADRFVIALLGCGQRPTLLRRLRV